MPEIERNFPGGEGEILKEIRIAAQKKKETGKKK